MLEQQKVVKEFAMSKNSLILVLQKKTTEVSQVANMLLISNKISINKNKQIYFFYFSYFSLLIFYTSPRQWGLSGYLLLAKVE